MLHEEEQSQESNPESLPNGEEEQQDPGEDPQNPSQTEEPTDGLATPTPVAGASDFSHPSLKGRTPREIELYVQQLETAQPTAPPSAAPPASPQPEEEEPEWSWDNPGQFFKKFEERIDRKLKETVAPFREQATRTEQEQARAELRQSLAHFERIEPTINAAIRQSGGDPAKVSKAQLTQMYYTTLGFMQSQGIDINTLGEQPTGGDVTTQPQGDRRPPAPPQHRPSAAPLPKAPGKKAPTLTENEARLARERGMTAEEYVRLRDSGPDEIVKPGFSTAGA